MAGSYIDEPRTTQPLRLQFHSLVIERQSGNIRAGGPEHHGRADISRVLHTNTIAGVQENARDQIERLLHSRHDRNLLGSAFHTA